MKTKFIFKISTVLFLCIALIGCSGNKKQAYATETSENEVAVTEEEQTSDALDFSENGSKETVFEEIDEELFDSEPEIPYHFEYYVSILPYISNLTSEPDTVFKVEFIAVKDAAGGYVKYDNEEDYSILYPYFYYTKKIGQYRNNPNDAKKIPVGFSYNLDALGELVFKVPLAEANDARGVAEFLNKVYYDNRDRAASLRLTKRGYGWQKVEGINKSYMELRAVTDEDFKNWTTLSAKIIAPLPPKGTLYIK